MMLDFHAEVACIGGRDVMMLIMNETAKTVTFPTTADHLAFFNQTDMDLWPQAHPVSDDDKPDDDDSADTPILVGD